MLVEIAEVVLTVAVFALILLLVDYYWHRWPVKNFPPGPAGWPVLGDTMLMRPDVHIEFEKVSQKYGRVFSIALGRFVIVVVNSQDATKEVLLKNMNATAGRGENYVQTLYNPEFRGINEGFLSENFQRQRHFTHTALRGFGFGKASFEEKVTIEVEETLGNLAQMIGRPFNPHQLLCAATSNVISSITFGVRFQYNGDKFRRLTQVSGNWFHIMYRSNSLNAFPYIRPFAKQMKRDIKSTYHGLSEYMQAEIKTHEASFQINGEPRDFIDCYLAEMQRQPGKYTRDDLIMILIDLFVGGTETSAALLTFALLYMMLNPDIQEKVHQEIMEVVGLNRLPSMKDQSSLPYTKAAIQEVLRISTLTPLVARSALTDITLAGYNIPKGTTIWINQWSLHHNPAAWPNPDKYDPSRFLNKPDTVAQSDNFLPFGAGRRVCFAEQLAKMELFLFFASMMQRFKFSLPPGYEKPSAKPVTKFLNKAPPFELMVSERS